MQTSIWTKAQRFQLDIVQLQKAHRAKYAETHDPADLAPFSLQYDAAFLTSLENDDRRTTAGAVSECPMRLVGLKIAENTHRLSTYAEIQGFLALQERNRQTIAEMNARVAGRQMITVAPAPLQPSSAK